MHTRGSARLAITDEIRETPCGPFAQATHVSNSAGLARDRGKALKYPGVLAAESPPLDSFAQRAPYARSAYVCARVGFHAGAIAYPVALQRRYGEGCSSRFSFRPSFLGPRPRWVEEQRGRRRRTRRRAGRVHGPPARYDTARFFDDR